MKKLLLILLCMPLIFSCGDNGKCIEGDCENGDGTYTWENGEKYVGEWKDGMRNGKGTFTYTDGTIAEGLWENNRFITEKTNQPLLVNDEYKSDKDCYIINVSAVKTEESARKKVKKLKNEGYESGFLWIPNFSSLSGAEYYSVFIGPFGTQLECEQATEDYRGIDPKAYGLLVSHENKRVKITGIGNVKVTEPYHNQ